LISVAAGMAKAGLRPWAYSIAPFVYARPFEQIRNDIAFNNLPVKIVGNGGGYAYGVMGPSHHAIEDYGVLLTLPNFCACVPAFDIDIDGAIDWVAHNGRPTYLRLGKGPLPSGVEVPQFAGWRQIIQGGGPVLVAIGPLAATYYSDLQAMPENIRPQVWVVSILPLDLNPPPDNFIAQIRLSQSLLVAEEHVERGGFGWELIMTLQKMNINLAKFKHFYARKHMYDEYGSQDLLRQKSFLDVASIISSLKDF